MLWFNPKQSISGDEVGCDELLYMHLADALIWCIDFQRFLGCLRLTHNKAWAGFRLRLYQVG